MLKALKETMKYMLSKIAKSRLFCNILTYFLVKIECLLLKYKSNKLTLQVLYFILNISDIEIKH